eukprot:434374-Pleurochrysis_carterae.AAC.1
MPHKAPLDGWVGGPDATPLLRDEVPCRRVIAPSLRFLPPPPIRALAKGGGGWGEQCVRSLTRWLRHRARSLVTVRGYAPFRA